MRGFAVVLAVLIIAPSAAAAELGGLPFQAVIAYEGFDFPVSFAFAPDGRLFVTEKAGAIKVVDAGVPRVWAQLDVLTEGEQGLLGLALHPEFPANGWVYVYHTDRGNVTNRVVRLRDAGGLGRDPTVILDGIPRATFHNGGIVVFGTDGTLFVSTGDAGNAASAQDIEALSGKVLRIHDEGSIPSDNPFPGNPVYSYGHRNVFGLAVDPLTGRMWETENGPVQHDEVNLLRLGGNYGWPTVMGVAGRPEFVDPLFVFGFPPPALTQATFYTGGAYGEANRNVLFFGGWNSKSVYRAVLAAGRQNIVSVEIVHSTSAAGILDVETGPDGRLYFSTLGAIFALATLRSLESGRDSHALVFGLLAAAVAVLAGAYIWKRRSLRGRERS